MRINPVYAFLIAGYVAATGCSQKEDAASVTPVTPAAPAASLSINDVDLDCAASLKYIGIMSHATTTPAGEVPPAYGRMSEYFETKARVRYGPVKVQDNIQFRFDNYLNGVVPAEALLNRDFCVKRYNTENPTPA